MPPVKRVTGHGGVALAFLLAPALRQSPKGRPAQANLWKVGIHATKVEAAGFIVPFMFVYGPAPMFQGRWVEDTWVLLTGCLGVLALAAGMQGWLLRPLGPMARAALLAAALLARRGWALRPAKVTD